MVHGYSKRIVVGSAAVAPSLNCRPYSAYDASSEEDFERMRPYSVVVTLLVTRALLGTLRGRQEI